MSAHSDHDRRDAEHAARSDIRVVIARYTRRLDELAKANIKAELERYDAGTVADWTEIGRDAAARAIASYISTNPQAAIDNEDRTAIEAGSDPSFDETNA